MGGPPIPTTQVSVGPPISTAVVPVGPQIPTIVVPLGPKSTHMICPHCNAEIGTFTKVEPGIIAYISGFLICLIG